MPHGYCIRWNEALLWGSVLGNGLIALAYFVIPTILLLFVLKHRVQFRAIYLMFAAFIVLCGLTHVMDVVVIWIPAYRLQATVIDLTAAASVGTAFALISVAREFSGFIARLQGTSEPTKGRD